MRAGGIMAGVKEVKMTPEQEQAEQKDVAEKRDQLSDELVNSLDLPAEMPESVGEPVEVETEEVVDEDVIDDTEDIIEDDIEESDIDDDEDLIPRSKYEKAIQRLEKRVSKVLEENRKLKSQSTQKATIKDPDMAKLEGMSKQELKDLRIKVKLAQRREDDDTKYADLLSLEDKIDTVIESAPKRFADVQVRHFQEKSQEIAEELNDDDTIDFKKASESILKTANDIYARYPKFKKLEEGQAIALEMAYEHWKEVQRLSAGKSKITDLKRKNSKLRKRTSLDRSSVRGQVSKDKTKKLFNKARTGTLYDKEDYIKNDPRFGIDQFIPDEFK